MCLMEQSNETVSSILLTQALLDKIVAFDLRSQPSCIKSDSVFWTDDRYYLFKTLPLDQWQIEITNDSKQQIALNVSQQTVDLINWFVSKYTIN